MGIHGARIVDERVGFDVGRDQKGGDAIVQWS